jgi:long-chain acyl-CoA synthetase
VAPSALRKCASIASWRNMLVIKALNNPQFRAALRAAVDRVNADVSVTEKVRQFEFTDEPFSIENGEMTPSMKIRRHIIRERYTARVNAMYKD